MASHPDVGPYKMTNDDVLGRLVEAITKGCTYKLACDYAGVTYSHFRACMRRGEAYLDQCSDDSLDPYGSFYNTIRKAEADAACKWLDKVEAASEAQWQAAAWKLERRYQKDYGKDRDDIDKKLEENNIELKSIREIISKCIKTE